MKIIKNILPDNIIALIILTGLISTLNTSLTASQISRITLTELKQKADLIVLAEVTQVTRNGNQDNVTIQIDSFLKGESEQICINFTLVTRGGLKDFDPALEKGETGVFFLKRKELEYDYEKAYWGSIAIFEKDIFTLSYEDYKQALKIWKSHRLQNDPELNIKDYVNGFQKGYNSPPGLVDGSADYNMGHSDGMQAKLGINPE